MKKLASFLFLTTILTGLKAQNNYIRYYQLVNEAKVKYADKHFDSAEVLLRNAFSLVDFVHDENLNFAIKLYGKTNNKEFKRKCLEQKKNNRLSINKSFKLYLDSIAAEDQRIRGRKYYKAQVYYYENLKNRNTEIVDMKFNKSHMLMKEWWSVDSTNVEALMKFISINGFPSEEKVGAQTNASVAIILLHFDRDTNNVILHSLLDTALSNGAIEPRNYAWIIDRHLMNAGKPQKYYTIPIGYDGLNNEQKEGINKSRLSIGMNNMKDVKIIRKKNSVTVIYN